MLLTYHLKIKHSLLYIILVILCNLWAVVCFMWCCINLCNRIIPSFLTHILFKYQPIKDAYSVFILQKTSRLFSVCMSCLLHSSFICIEVVLIYRILSITISYVYTRFMLFDMWGNWREVCNLITLDKFKIFSTHQPQFFTLYGLVDKWVLSLEGDVCRDANQMSICAAQCVESYHTVCSRSSWVIST
jgi:hypothetical protein